MILSVDIEKCTGCNLCEIACSLRHDKVISPLCSRIEVINVKEVADIPVYCYQCDDASCAAVCPVKAIEKDSSGVMSINKETCINCRSG